MPIYIAPVEDMMFLYEKLRNNKNYNEIEKYKEVTTDLVKNILEEAAKINQNIILPLAKSGDENPTVLENVKRSNISTDDLMQLAIDAAEIQADSRSEIILGMPGESLETHFKTNKTIVDAGFNKIDNYQLMMIPGTEVIIPETIKKFEMQIRYRILPRCFGYYEILDKTVYAAEIEKICTSTNTLSFDDYLQCRKLHFIIHLFYNDWFFYTLVKFIKSLNLSVFDWLQLIFEQVLSGNIKELFDSFLNETENELYQDRDELYKLTQRREIIDSYIKGELGYNLLFVYKASVLSNFIDDLMNLAKE